MIGWKPLPRHTVQPFKDGSEVYYRISPGDKPSYVLNRADVIHLPSLGFDGLTSPSPLTYAALEAIGTALAAQDHAGKFFSGGANFDYALKSEKKLDEKQMQLLKASLIARAQNGGRGPLILGGGLVPAQLSVNSKDAEILATRLFTVEEICRIFGVPPHMVGHTEKQSSQGSGIAEQGASFVRYTLQRHLTPIQQELNSKLWPVRQKYFVEHITAALERGDIKARYEGYRIALGRAGEMPFMTASGVECIASPFGRPHELVDQLRDRAPRCHGSPPQQAGVVGRELRGPRVGFDPLADAAPHEVEVAPLALCVDVGR